MCGLPALAAVASAPFGRVRIINLDGKVPKWKGTDMCNEDGLTSMTKVLNVMSCPFIRVAPKGREAVLQELHEGHPGITKMISLARMHMWWPNLEDI